MASLTLPAIMKQLGALYDPPKTFLDFTNPLELLVATILSAQCTDAMVNKVTPKLFARCKTAQDYVDISRNELEDLVHSCGTYKMKAKHIQEMCALLLERHDGNVPASFDDLIALPGVGKKTAAVVLSAAFSRRKKIRARSPLS